MAAKRLSRFALAILFALSIGGPRLAADSLQSQAERIVYSTKLGKATLGVLVTDLASGEDLIRLKADEPLIPASTLKLLTAAAALARLGRDHVFTTELRMDGDTLRVRG